LAVCCLILVIAIGVGTGIGVAVGKNIDDDPTFIVSSPSSTTTTAPALPTVAVPTPAPSTAAPFDFPIPGVSTPAPATATTTAPVEPSPTAAPDPLLSLLIANSFDGGAALATANSPQFLAREWLSGNANLADYSEEVTLQRYALAAFFYASNGETTWDDATRNSWLTDESECLWSSTATSPCDGLVYSTLAMNFLGVTGTIAPEIGLLTGLTRFSVRSNAGEGMSGAIPDSIGNLVGLTALLLQDNLLTGVLPSEIGNLVAMSEFGGLLEDRIVLN
jgi:hypothetical protein